MIKSNFVNRFVFEEMDKRRAYYEGLSKAFFYHEFNVERDYFVNAFVAYCKKNNYPIEMGAKEESTLLQSIKAYMALQLFDEALFIQLLNEKDEFIIFTLDHINN